MVTRTFGEIARQLGLSKSGIIEAVQICQSFQYHGLLQPASAGLQMAESHRSLAHLPGVRLVNLGSGARKRPTPRGISGPA